MLDLHGVKHQEVHRLIDVAIWEHIKKGYTTLTVVTGSSPEMKNLVRECVSDYAGMSCREDFSNGASLIIEL